MQNLSTTERGKVAENQALRLLQDRGYRFVQRNFNSRGGEIDLIAYDDDILCFIEVRSKEDTQHGHPIETINHKKKERLIKAAEYYLTEYGLNDQQCRFDVVTIVYQPVFEIQLFKDAFRKA